MLDLMTYVIKSDAFVKNPVLVNTDVIFSMMSKAAQILPISLFFNISLFETPRI